MIDFFEEETRRNPYPLYDELRRRSPLVHDPQADLWMVFDYAGVKRVLEDHDTFSSKHGPAEWMIFLDPPRHTKLRALVSQAFTPRTVASLEPRITELARELLRPLVEQREVDFAAEFATPLPMMVIAEMLGIPLEDRSKFKRWNDVILRMSYTVPAGKPQDGEVARVVNEFVAVTIEMNDYLSDLLSQRRAAPRDDLLSRLATAAVDGEHLTQPDILGFFQLLLLAGQETTTNLINNAVLCFIEHPDVPARLRASPDLLPSAIEEVLRYRSPLSWMYRVTRREVELHGQTILPGKLVLAMIGSANRDPRQFPDANRFDIARNPNPHIAFGHGLHFCLGAALARLEAKVALTELLKRVQGFEPATDEPWEPRKGLHVHGPARLPIRMELVRGAVAAV